MEFLLQKKDEKINELLVKVDNLEQKEYDRDVQIVGLTETKSEKDDLKCMLKLAKEKMGIKLKTADVKSIHRLGKKTQSKKRDMIVSFSDSSVRDAFYQKRKTLSVNKDPSKNIYVNDRLTDYRKGLFFATRKLYKAKKLFATWTQKGNVLVRKDEDSAVVQIHSYRDLDVFMRASSTASEVDSRLSSGSFADILSNLSDYYYEDDDVV